MTTSIEEILTLEQLDLNLFRSQHHCENFRHTLFGGQVLGQALKAAYLTQENALPHSLHAYFLRAGNSETPVIYDVEKVRDGRSIASRRVLARQMGRPIYNMSASFHRPEEGYHHQVGFPANIPDPEILIAKRKAQGDIMDNNRHLKSLTLFDFIPVENSIFSKEKIEPAKAYFWLKAANPLEEEQIVHHCALAFASDFGLLATSMLPHSGTLFDDDIIAASIDHAMWFHKDKFRADEWMLCATYSPWAGKARGFAQAHIFERGGELIASTTQEGLIRPTSVYTE